MELQIKNIKRIKLEAPVKVYDLEVDHPSHNFKLAAGNFVHNCGKTTIVQKYAKANGYGYVGINGGESSPEDILGFPVNQNGEAVNLKPDWFKKVEEESKTHDKVILFIDELTTASEYVQSPLLKVIFDRMVGQRRLPDNVEILSAGNYQENLGQNFDLISPIINRFMVYNLKSVTREDFQLFLDPNFSASIDFRQSPPEKEVDEAVIQEVVLSFFATKSMSLDLMNNTELSDLYRGQKTVFNPPTWRSVSRLKPLLKAAAERNVIDTMVFQGLVNGLIGSLPADDMKNYKGDVGMCFIEMINKNPIMKPYLEITTTLKDADWYLTEETGIMKDKVDELLNTVKKDKNAISFDELCILMRDLSSRLWETTMTGVKNQIKSNNITKVKGKEIAKTNMDLAQRILDHMETLVGSDESRKNKFNKAVKSISSTLEIR